MRNSLHNIICFLIIIPGIAFTSFANEDVVNDGREGLKSVFDRLAEQEVLTISVKTDIDKLLTKRKSKNYQGAVMSFDDSSDLRPEWNVELRTRGKYRKKICDFPPIKIKFNHSIFKSEHLKPFKSLNLVTHCGENEESEELLVREYLAYKIYNLITDRSLRVQLVKINWEDTSGKYDLGQKWGFFIENDDEMALRLGGGIYDEFGVSHNDVHSESASQHALFQYLIGNADWNLEMNKNIHFVKNYSTGEVFVVPYDFDFSGLVNASYAVTEYGMTSVKERIFLGQASDEDLALAIESFREKEHQIVDLVKSFEHIGRSARNDVKRYVQSFFNSLDEPLLTESFYRERIKSGAVVSRQN